MAVGQSAKRKAKAFLHDHWRDGSASSRISGRSLANSLRGSMPRCDAGERIHSVCGRTCHHPTSENYRAPCPLTEAAAFDFSLFASFATAGVQKQELLEGRRLTPTGLQHVQGAGAWKGRIGALPQRPTASFTTCPGHQVLSAKLRSQRVVHCRLCGAAARRPAGSPSRTGVVCLCD